MDSPLEVTRYDAQKERQTLAQFASRSWGEKSVQADAARWDWLYAKNPFAGLDGPKIWLIKHAGEIVAHFATIPVPLKIGGRTCIADWGIDLFVHPEYRKRGLSRQIMDHAEKQVHLIMALGTNPVSLKILKDIAWRPLGKVRLGVRMLNAPSSPGNTFKSRIASLASSGLASLFGLLRMGQRHEVRPVEYFNGDFDTLWERLSVSVDVGVTRDARFLNWRYRGYGKDRYKAFQVLEKGTLAGYAVVRIKDTANGRLGTIVDLLAEEHALDSLLGSLLDFFRQNQVSRAECYVSDKQHHRALLRWGFLPWKSDAYFLIKGEAMKRDGRLLEAMDNWFLTKGDSDLDR